MNPAEIVVGEVQRHGCFVILQLSAEFVGQPNEATGLHPHRRVLPLAMRDADF